MFKDWNAERVDAFIKGLDASVKAFASIMLVSVFSGAMFTILYSLVFVTQPMKDMAPADKAFFEILKMMVAFLAGVITNMVNNKISSPMPMQSPCPPAMGMPSQSIGSMPYTTVSSPINSYTQPSTAWQPSGIVPAAPHLDNDDDRARHAEARYLHKDW